MSCGLSIATRAGQHLKCILDDNHEGSCLPQLPSLPFFTPTADWPRWSWAAAKEHEFVGHLLAIVESAGDTLTFLEALNIARALCRARLGVPERRL